MIEENLKKVKENISEACTESGRNNGDVKLIAVSKRKPVELIKEAFEAGQLIFGENQVQEALTKHEALLEDLGNTSITLHLIGSLQTNKVKHLSKFCSLFHGLDRFELADAIQKRMEFENSKMDCLVQVNVSDENSKSGFDPEKITEEFNQFEKYDRVRIKGLMAIAENTESENKIRDNFKKMRNIFENLKAKELSKNIEMKELSMGMSGDYKIAIEEGSTMVRVGSAIFGDRIK